MAETLPHVPLTLIPQGSSPDLGDTSNVFPALDPITTSDSVGPQAANRQPNIISRRTETLRTSINLLIDVVNALGLNFLHRDGTATQSQGLANPSFMRGNLSMEDPTGPTRYQVKGVAAGSEDTDGVNKAQLDALAALVTTLTSQVGSDYVRRDGTLAMLANLDMGGFQIENLGVAVNPADAIRKDTFDAAISALQTGRVARDGSNSMTGPLNMGGNRITGLPTTGYPSLDGDFVTKKYVDDSLNSIAAVPTGTVTPFAGGTVPLGYVLCDGRTLTTANFPELFAAIGYTYGGSGGTFNVPDLRGRIPAGMDDYGALSATGPANRIAVPEADVLGGTFGSELVTLTIDHIPSHTHSMSDYYFADGTGGALRGAASSVADADTLYTQVASTNSAGGGLPHNNVQPSIAMLYIIKS